MSNTCYHFNYDSKLLKMAARSLMAAILLINVASVLNKELHVFTRNILSISWKRD